jgi:hypothetical protein
MLAYHRTHDSIAILRDGFRDGYYSGAGAPSTRS